MINAFMLQYVIVLLRNTDWRQLTNNKPILDTKNNNNFFYFLANKYSYSITKNKQYSFLSYLRCTICHTRNFCNNLKTIT